MKLKVKFNNVDEVLELLRYGTEWTDPNPAPGPFHFNFRKSYMSMAMFFPIAEVKKLAFGVHNNISKCIAAYQFDQEQVPVINMLNSEVINYIKPCDDTKLLHEPLIISGNPLYKWVSDFCIRKYQKKYFFITICRDGNPGFAIITEAEIEEMLTTGKRPKAISELHTDNAFYEVLPHLVRLAAGYRAMQFTGETDGLKFYPTKPLTAENGE